MILPPISYKTTHPVSLETLEKTTFEVNLSGTCGDILNSNVDIISAYRAALLVVPGKRCRTDVPMHQRPFHLSPKSPLPLTSHFSASTCPPLDGCSVCCNHCSSSSFNISFLTTSFLLCYWPYFYHFYNETPPHPSVCVCVVEALQLLLLAFPCRVTLSPL